MKQLNIDLKLIRNIVILYTFVGVIIGYPIAKKDISEDHDLKDEKMFSNGTVVGKYLYKDSDGNPIHVKYYADDSGYGVELKSFKISTGTPEITEATEEPKFTKYVFKNDEDVDNTTPFNPIYDHKTTNNPFEVLPKNSKTSKDKYKTSPDYEIFVDSELKTPKKCGQDKVHVYFENNKRKARNTYSELDVVKYCEQFQFP